MMIATENISVFEKHRSMLVNIEEDHTLIPLLQTIGARRGWWNHSSDWRRIYERFDPFLPRMATLVYETVEAGQQLCVIELYADQPGQRAGAPSTCHVPGLGWIRIARFPADPRLPALQQLLTLPGHWHVLRYRPCKRCTLKYNGQKEQAPLFAKVFPDGRGELSYYETEKMWKLHQAGNFEFALAEPIRWDVKTHTFWQKAVPGVPVKQRLFNKGGEILSYRMGKALASLTATPFKIGNNLSPGAQMMRTLRYGNELCRRVPGLQNEMDVLLFKLQSIHDSSYHTRLYPLHGSPHMGQWLIDGDRLGLVDFDRISMGEPELDVATFIAEMDFEKPTIISRNDIIDGFIAGFESSGIHLNRQLLNAYRAHKRLSKALKASRALRPDGDERAAKHLKRALSCLDRGEI